jgi:hypothetical protein
MVWHVEVPGVHTVTEVKALLMELPAGPLSTSIG